MAVVTDFIDSCSSCRIQTCDQQAVGKTEIQLTTFICELLTALVEVYAPLMRRAVLVYGNCEQTAGDKKILATL